MRRLKTMDGDIVFIHIPKVAGCSIERSMDGIGATEPYPTHGTATEFRNKCDWDSVKSFAVVRNPYEQRASQWTEMSKIGPLRPHLLKWKSSFKEWINWAGEVKPNPWDTLEKYPYQSLTNRPQSFYVEGGVSKIIRYENLEEEFALLCKEWGMGIESLPMINVSTNKPLVCDISPNYLDWYTDEMKEIVYSIYREDFDNFGYSK